MSKVIETDVLVVGAGPAGAATAMLLGRMGIRTLIVAKHRGVADTPRAHIVNQRAMEVMRNSGLEEACIDVGVPGKLLENTFWLKSMGGDELARCWTWGNDPARISDYLTASPCKVMDLPQNRMEPILINEATRVGVNVRFGWELVDFEQDDAGVTAQVRDRLADCEFTVRAKYMVGADGARSRVVEKLGIPLIGEQEFGPQMYNVHCQMDLTAYTEHRHASFYIISQPESTWSPMVVTRMVRPWTEWLVGIMVAPHVDKEWKPSHDDFIARIRQSIGKDAEDLPISIVSTSNWRVNDVHAEYLSVGRVHCIGDAVHRHPPARALGSNTCLQDAFNLAWKLAYVIQGKAGPKLLDSFNQERQPIAAQIVKCANSSMADAAAIAMTFIGAGFQTGDSANAYATPEGRAKVRQLMDTQRYNGHAHGVEMMRNYTSGAVIDDGSPASVLTRDAQLYYEPSSRPGSCLPHAWLVGRAPGPRFSTLDITGKGKFHLLSGHGGEAWKEAAQQVGEELGIDLGVSLIGAGLDYEDPYYEWNTLRGVEDNGCVLVRPDQIVAWRQTSLTGDPAASLRTALKEILALA